MLAINKSFVEKLPSRGSFFLGEKHVDMTVTLGKGIYVRDYLTVYA